MACICLVDLMHENKTKIYLNKKHLEITPLPLKYQFMWEETLQLVNKVQDQCTVRTSTDKSIN